MRWIVGGIAAFVVGTLFGFSLKNSSAESAQAEADQIFEAAQTMLKKAEQQWNEANMLNRNTVYLLSKVKVDEDD